MKIFYLYIGITLIFFSVNVSAEEQVGILKTVTGDVIIHRMDSDIIARPGMHLTNLDSLITKNKSYAGVIFTDGTTFTFGPNTEFTLNHYEFEPNEASYDFTMHLKKGSAIYNSGKIGKLSPESIKLTTPRATVGIRGTRFIITVE